MASYLLLKASYVMFLQHNAYGIIDDVSSLSSCIFYTGYEFLESYVLRFVILFMTFCCVFAVV